MFFYTFSSSNCKVAVEINAAYRDFTSRSIFQLENFKHYLELVLPENSM